MGGAQLGRKADMDLCGKWDILYMLYKLYVLVVFYCSYIPFLPMDLDKLLMLNYVHVVHIVPSKEGVHKMKIRFKALPPSPS